MKSSATHIIEGRLNPLQLILKAVRDREIKFDAEYAEYNN